MEILNLSDKKEWKELLKNSPDNFEILIYKYSPICPVSYSTDVILDEWIELNNTNPHLRIIKVNVILSRSLSRRIAKDLKVEHESPQVIWIDNKIKVKFHTSHFGITKEVLDKYL